MHPTVSITKPSSNMLCFVFVRTIEHIHRFCKIFPTQNKTPLCTSTCTVVNELIVSAILIAAESMQVPLGQPLLRHQMWTISWHEVTVISNPNDSFLKDLLFIMAHLSSGIPSPTPKISESKRNSFQTNNFTGQTGNSCNVTVHS